MQTDDGCNESATWSHRSQPRTLLTDNIFRDFKTIYVTALCSFRHSFVPVTVTYRALLLCTTLYFRLLDHSLKALCVSLLQILSVFQIDFMSVHLSLKLEIPESSDKVAKRAFTFLLNLKPLHFLLYSNPLKWIFQDQLSRFVSCGVSLPWSILDICGKSNLINE